MLQNMRPDDIVSKYVGSFTYAQAGANRMMSVLHEKATVKKEELYEVVGNNDYHVSHLLDEKYKLTWNCEHFSHQVQLSVLVNYNVLVNVLNFKITALQGCIMVKYFTFIYY
uniref:Uncharacterized protein n=1 Tax=Sinocyclocheilus grahami TaxID=75366 RepID=A0A672MWR0_SINGR